MSRYVIHGSQLNGRDQWIFEADDYNIKDGLIVASGSFERKRHFTVLHVPLTSIIYIEEPPQPASRRPRRLRRTFEAAPDPLEAAAANEPVTTPVTQIESKRRPGRPRKNPLPAAESHPAVPRRRGRPPKAKVAQ